MEQGGNLLLCVRADRLVHAVIDLNSRVLYANSGYQKPMISPIVQNLDKLSSLNIESHNSKLCTLKSR